MAATRGRFGDARVWRWLAALALLAGACSPATVRPEAEVSDGAAATSTTVAPTAAPPTTAATAPATGTPATSTTVPVRRLQLTVEPQTAVAAAVIVNGEGEALPADLPFDGQVRGPVTVYVEADGYAPLVQDVALERDRNVRLWLDQPGQLLHKVAEWSTGGAPKQVAFTPDGSEIWVTLLNGRGFEIYDAVTGELLANPELGDDGSVEVVFNRAGTRAYVSQMETASVYEIDVATREVLRTLDTEGAWTKVMLLSPDEQTLWASNWSSNDVSEIDLVTGEVRARMRTVTTPRGLYVTPDAAKLYVAGFENGDIEVIDLATREGEVIHRSGGAMRHLVGDPEAGLMYASDMSRHHVLVVDTATDEVSELADVDRMPNTIDISPDGRVLFVSNRGRNNPNGYVIPGPEWGTVVVIDTATGAYLDAVIGGNQTTGLDVSYDGTMLAFSDFLDNRVTVYRVPSYSVLVSGGGGRWEEHLAEIAK